MAASVRASALLRIPAALASLSEPPSSVLVAVLLPRLHAGDPSAGGRLAELACHKAVAEILDHSGTRGEDHPLSRLEVMPVVMGAGFGEPLPPLAGREGKAGDAHPDDPSPVVPLGIVEMAFAGARSGASSSSRPRQRVAVSLFLPQAVAARDPSAAAKACSDTVSSHGLVVLAQPPGSMPFPPTAEDIAAALRAAPGHGGEALAAALTGAAAKHRLAAVEAADDGAPRALPPLALDAMPPHLLGSQPHVVIGGTFDRLHAGHWKLVSAAAALAGSKLTVGVTSDAMVAGKSGAELIARQDERAAAVKAAALRVAPGLSVSCPIIDDPVGPAASDATMSAIVVSSETASGADAINTLRIKAGLPLLQSFVVRRIGAAGLSSTELRRE